MTNTRMGTTLANTPTAPTALRVGCRWRKAIDHRRPVRPLQAQIAAQSGLQDHSDGSQMRPIRENRQGC